MSGIRYFSIDHMIIGMAIPRMKALPSVLKKKVRGADARLLGFFDFRCPVRAPIDKGCR